MKKENKNPNLPIKDQQFSKHYILRKIEEDESLDLIKEFMPEEYEHVVSDKELPAYKDYKANNVH